jgi:hypothetical protein
MTFELPSWPTTLQTLALVTSPRLRLQHHAYKFVNVKIYHNVLIEEYIIVLLVDGIHTLVDVIIVDFIRVDLVSQMVFSLGGGGDYGSLGEGRTLLRLLCSGHVFSFFHKGLWVSSPTI